MTLFKRWNLHIISQCTEQCGMQASFREIALHCTILYTSLRQAVTNLCGFPYLYIGNPWHCTFCTVLVQSCCRPSLIIYTLYLSKTGNTFAMYYLKVYVESLNAKQKQLNKKHVIRERYKSL